MRRRFVWIQGGVSYAAAILYEVVNGANSEIWLQDDGGTPVLITSIPRRVELGWSATASDPNFASGPIIAPLGHIARVRDSLFPYFFLDDPRTTFEGFLNEEDNVEFTIDVSFEGIPASDPLGFIATPEDEMYLQALVNFNFPLPDRFHVPYRETILNSYSFIGVRGSFSEGITATIHSVTNFVSAFLQRRSEGTYVYIRHTLYHSETDPVPDYTTGGQVWLQSQYWTAGSGPDITASVMDSPLARNLIINNPGSPLDGDGLNSTRNWITETTNTETSLVGWLTNGETEEFTFSGIDGNAVTASFQGAPANARRVLSVAIYPKT